MRKKTIKKVKAPKKENTKCIVNKLKNCTAKCKDYFVGIRDKKTFVMCTKVTKILSKIEK